MKEYLTLNDISVIKSNFEMRNIEFEYFETEEDFLHCIKKEVLEYNSFGIGNSQTLKRLKITDMLLDMGLRHLHSENFDSKAVS